MYIDNAGLLCCSLTRFCGGYLRINLNICQAGVPNHVPHAPRVNAIAAGRVCYV